jgi:hypothetical protein
MFVAMIGQESGKSGFPETKMIVDRLSQRIILALSTKMIARVLNDLFVSSIYPL